MTGQAAYLLNLHPHAGGALPRPPGRDRERQPRRGADEPRHRCQRLVATAHPRPTGIAHIESGDATQFTLGQFFTERNIRLTSSCQVGLCADSSHQLAVLTNGRLDTGDPRALVPGAHQEIAIEYGPRGPRPAPPSSYPFPAGL